MKSTNGRPAYPRRVRIWATVFWMVAFLAPGAALAAEGEMTVQEAMEAREALERKIAANAGQEMVYDELGRGTPQKLWLGYAAASRASDYERGARYLDLSQLPAAAPDDAGPRLAWQMRHVLAQVMGATDYVAWLNSLDTSPEGRLDDGLPPQFERFANVPSRAGEIDILLERVPREDGARIWKVSAQSVGQLPGLWEEYGYWGLEELLPRFFFHIQLPHRIQPWQWIGLLLLAAGGTLLGWLVARAIRFGLRRLRFDLGPQLGRFAPGPVGLLAALLVFTLGTTVLRLAVTSRTYVGAAERFVLVVALTWLAVRLADMLLETVRIRLLRRRRPGVAAVVLPTVRRLTQILIVAVAVILFLNTLGFNVTALVAGLGVGGLAVALAAQRTIENFIGGITLYADQPVRVGDFCRFGGVLGTVEEIGLRSTRVRTLARTVVSVPNAEFSNLQLDNLERRDKFWFHPKLRLRYETTPDQLRCVLVEVRKLLYGHPRVDNGGARIRFRGFGDFSLDLEIFAYVLAQDYASHLEVVEDLSLRIMEIVATAGTSFALPSQTTYIEEGSSLPPEAAKAAEERVQGWREKNELFLPSFPSEAIDALRGSVDYPPTGSPGVAKAAS